MDNSLPNNKPYKEELRDGEQPTSEDNARDRTLTPDRPDQEGHVPNRDVNEVTEEHPYQTPITPEDAEAARTNQHSDDDLPVDKAVSDDQSR